MNIRNLTGYKKEANKEERTIIALGSTESIDRHGTIVRVSAWDLKNFKKNRVILLNHNYQSIPIARSMWEKPTPEGLLFKIQFADTEEGRELFKLYDEGFMNAFSVGFNARKEEIQKIEGRDVTVYTDVELYELSCVTVPSNVDSLMVRSTLNNIKSKSIKAEFEKAMGSNQKNTSMENPTDKNKNENEIMKKTIDSLNEELESSKIINKSLTKNISEMKINKKIMNLDSDPSVSDIATKVIEKIRNDFSGYMYYINDFYPVNYPDGNIVVEEIDRDWNLVKMINIEYSYNDGEIEIISEKEVKEQYVEKKMESINKRLSDKKFDDEISKSTVDELIAINKSINNILKNDKVKNSKPEAEQEIELEDEIEEDILVLDDEPENDEIDLDDTDFETIFKSIKEDNIKKIENIAKENKIKIEEKLAKAKGKMYI